jgi:hypothetical protein
LVFVALILVGGLGLGGYYWSKHKNDGILAPANSTSLYLDPQADPKSVITSVPPAPAVPAVLGTEIGSIGTGIGTKVVKDQNLRFIIEIPNDWTAKQNPTETIIFSPDSRQYSIQMYASPSNDMAALKTYLSTRPNLHSIMNSSLDGWPVLSFSVDGPYKHGVAFLENNRLYYLLGQDIENSPVAQSFKTF